MSPRTSPPRSFNTVKHSNREQRIKRLRLERKVMLALFAVFCAILLTLTVFFICSTADLISDHNPGGSDESDTQQTGNSSTPEGILFRSITKASADFSKGELVIVNADHYFEPSTALDLKNIYNNRLKYENIHNTYQVPNTEWKLNGSAIDAFNRMMLKFYELEGDGSIKISSAYRSYEDQENSTTSSTLPGHSDHHTGYCLALRTGNGGYLDEEHWIYQNCHKYGYVVRYPDSKAAITGVDGYEYCFRYVGIPHAYYIHENNYCLEEYVELIKSTYTPDKTLKITTSDGGRYEVYYVAAGSEELTVLKVPANYSYTVSGDNIGGFIVTVNLNEAVE